MFKIKQLIPFGKTIDSDEYIKKFSYTKPSLKRYDFIDDEFGRKESNEDNRLHNSLKNYTVTGTLDYNETMTRFIFKLRVDDATTIENFDILIDDKYPICIDRMNKLDSSEKRLVLMSLYKKLMAIALNDIRLYQPGSIYLYGVDGFCFQKSIVQRNVMTNKAINLNTIFRKNHHFVDIENYYDKIINTLFERIFNFKNEENPIYQFSKRMVFHNEETSELRDNLPEIIERRFSSTGTIRYRIVEQSFDPRNDNRSKTISGKDLIPVYYIPSLEMSRSKHINRNRRMDLYIDLIVYFINNDFSVEKTLQEYEYRRRRINSRTKNYNSNDEEYVRYIDNEDNSISEPYNNYPSREGMSHTISYLYDHRIELTVPDFKDIIYDTMVPAVIVYTDESKIKLDKEWLLSQNSNAFFKLNRFDEYKRDLKNDEVKSWGNSNALFAPTQQVAITDYKEKVTYEYDSIVKENTFLENEVIFNIIDSRIPQPDIRHYKEPTDKCR